MCRWLVLLALACLARGGLRAAETPAQDLDGVGVKKLYPTAAGGREWFAAWDRPRPLAPFQHDPLDALMRNSAETVRVGGGLATVPPGVTRLYVLTPVDAQGRPTAPEWKNVEMTIYARRGPVTRQLDYQALDLSARSGARHDDKSPCEGTSYHATWRFDGQCGFKKEIWHTGGYTQLMPQPAPRPWATVPEGEWIGLKFVCRNLDADRHVQLQMYLDRGERNEWELVAEHVDRGGWKGAQPGCDRAQDYILREARPAVYFRADYTPVELKHFSVREIEALP